MIKDERGQWIISAGFLVSASIVILALLLNQAMMGGYQSSGAILEFPKHEIRELVQETHREVNIAATKANEKPSAEINSTFENMTSNYTNSVKHLYAAHGQMAYVNVSSSNFTDGKISAVNVTILFSDGVTTCTFEPEIIEIPGVSEQAQNTMHVDSIDMWNTEVGLSGKYWIYTKVKIVDASNAAVVGATVYLNTTLPDSTNESDFGDTGDDGWTEDDEFKYGKTETTGTYTSTVTNVAKDGWTYVPADNVETSNSTTVP
ncbi:MAG: hypothetical protein WA977_10070 [Halobacteriota archaeon]